MHSEHYISDPLWLSKLDNIEDDVDILCNGENQLVQEDWITKMDPALKYFLDNNKLAQKLRKLIRAGDYLKDVHCNMGVLVLSRKAAKAGF